jgi:hypothetical protein
MAEDTLDRTPAFQDMVFCILGKALASLFKNKIVASKLKAGNVNLAFSDQIFFLII